MIHYYELNKSGHLCLFENEQAALAALDKVVWIDMLGPTDAEEEHLEATLGLDIPTREDMEEIEASSRLYQENGATFMTASVLSHSSARPDVPEMQAVTFVLAAHRLLTVRYHEPRPFQTFVDRAERADIDGTNGEAVAVSLVEAIVDRLADILEGAARTLDDIAKSIFVPGGRKPGQGSDLARVLERIGLAEDANAKIRASLASFDRLASFLMQMSETGKSVRNRRERLKTLSRDLRSLSDYATGQSQKITFLLDATLGMINIEQNAIIKIFSVVAVVFLPPTLIASIYGMNFHLMPELSWPFGYPFALGLMILSAILPYLFFKRRGWL
ncbi:MAG: magnesium/cobalt transporter CorA [Paracoccaceae bacterium]